MLVLRGRHCAYTVVTVRPLLRLLLGRRAGVCGARAASRRLGPKGLPVHFPGGALAARRKPRAKLLDLVLRVQKPRLHHLHPRHHLRRPRLGLQAPAVLVLAHALEFPDAVVRIQLPHLRVCGLAPRLRFGLHCHSESSGNFGHTRTGYCERLQSPTSGLFNPLRLFGRGVTRCAPRRVERAVTRRASAAR